MAANIPSPFRIAVIGMDARAHAALDLAFQKLGKGCATLAEPANAEGFIFNMDVFDAHTRWQHYRTKFPEHPTIIVSMKDPGMEGTVYVAKPLSMPNLIQAIAQLRTGSNKARNTVTPKGNSATKIAGRGNSGLYKYGKPVLVPLTPVIHELNEHKGYEEYCGTARDVDLSDKHERSKIFYNPEGSLQGVLETAWRQAMAKDNAVILAIKIDEIWESITLLSGIDKVVTTMDDKQLCYLCTSPLYCVATRLLYPNASKTRELEQQALVSSHSGAMESFFWKIALWTAHGRLPEDTKVMQPVRLKRWPNFTRLVVTPGALSMAALLNDKAMPLALLAKVMGLPQRYIFSFYSAARSLKLIVTESANAQPDSIQQKRNQQHLHHNLFGRILQKLKQAV